jgi:hypothetical protein
MRFLGSLNFCNGGGVYDDEIHKGNAMLRDGRILIHPPMGKKTGGAPASGTAALLRAHAKAPCRRPALHHSFSRWWQCQEVLCARLYGRNLAATCAAGDDRIIAMPIRLEWDTRKLMFGE